MDTHSPLKPLEVKNGTAVLIRERVVDPMMNSPESIGIQTVLRNKTSSTGTTNRVPHREMGTGLQRTNSQLVHVIKELSPIPRQENYNSIKSGRSAYQTRPIPDMYVGGGAVVTGDIPGGFYYPSDSDTLRAPIPRSAAMAFGG